MFQRILVPIDGSPTSAAGLREAIALAKDQHASLYLVHVVDEFLVTQGLDGTSYVAPNYIESIFAALREQGKRLLDKAATAAERQSVKYQTMLVETVGHAWAAMPKASAPRAYR